MAVSRLCSSASCHKCSSSSVVPKIFWEGNSCAPSTEQNAFVRSHPSRAERDLEDIKDSRKWQRQVCFLNITPKMPHGMLHTTMSVSKCPFWMFMFSFVCFVSCMSWCNHVSMGLVPLKANGSVGCSKLKTWTMPLCTVYAERFYRIRMKVATSEHMGRKHSVEKKNVVKRQNVWRRCWSRINAHLSKQLAGNEVVRESDVTVSLLPLLWQCSHCIVPCDLHCSRLTSTRGMWSHSGYFVSAA